MTKIARTKLLQVMVVVSGFLLAGSVVANDNVVPNVLPEKKPEAKKKKDGWDFLLTPGASVSLSDNRAVIGQPEGLTIVLGANVASGAFFRAGPHEWRSTLNLTELFSRSPQLGDFVKSTDLVKLESVYLFDLLDWLGPFAKVNIDTVLLESFDVRSEATRWSISRTDGSVETRDGFNLRLADGFEPLTLKETAGFFADIYDSKPFKTSARLGVGGVHVFADGALSVSDDAATPEVEVLELRSYSQFGGVLELTAGGELYSKKIVYKLGAEFMMPFVNDLQAGDNRNVIDLTNIELTASLSFKVLSWLSIDYAFRVLRQPQLLDKFQIQNNLLLTASYSFFKPDEKKD